MARPAGTPATGTPATGTPATGRSLRLGIEAAYVAVVAGLTAVGFGLDGEAEVVWAIAAAFALCLPTMLAALPIFYVVVAAAWSLAGTSASSGACSSFEAAGAGCGTDEGSLVVGLAYLGVMVGAAAANVAVLRALTRALAARRAPRGTPA